MNQLVYSCLSGLQWDLGRGGGKTYALSAIQKHYPTDSTAVVGMVDLMQGLCDPALGVFRANIDKREYIRKSIYIPKSQWTLTFLSKA